MPVPHPNDAAANKTNECVAECPQGEGSEAETEAYASCIQKCIGDNFYSLTQGPTAQPTGTGSDASVTPEVTTITSGSSTFEATVTPTRSSSGSSESGSSDDSSDSDNADSTEPPNAGAMLTPLGSTGLLGLVAAFLAI